MWWTNTRISLKCYKKIPNIDKLSKFNDRNYFIAPTYSNLDSNIQQKIVDEISVELSRLTNAQILRLEEIEEKKGKYNPILRGLFFEFQDRSEYLYSLLVGTPAGIYLKRMIEHHNNRINRWKFKLFLIQIDLELKILFLSSYF